MGNPTLYRTANLSATQCLSEGWELIKDDYLLFLGITLVGGLIAGAVPIVLVGPMMCGIFLCLLNRMKGQRVPFEMLFKGFDYFVKSLIATLILAGVTMAFIMGLMAFFCAGSVAAHSVGKDDEAVMVLVMAVLVILAIPVGLLINVIFLFVFPLIVDKDVEAMEAVRLSFGAAKANLGGLLLLMLLLMLVSVLGLLVCVVGVYLVLPVIYAAQAVAYRKVFPAS